ncbi:MAG: hypothetical protein HRU70_08360 [Phycisphaeraceae bacterium]|nr:MAG: hypothetical protein HRU70_08360 [Phycisphaeraceae bacterium]
MNYLAHTVDGTAGRQAVGSANHARTGNRNAILWDFDSASPTVLHPAGARWSYATATDGRTQGGRVFFNTFGQFHAALWSGSADSYVDLHPAGMRRSEVHGVADGVQVGEALTTQGRARAMLWRGTAQSAVDLTPDDVYQAWVYATTGQYHVGTTYTLDVGSRATLWLSDDPASAVNLHHFLDDGWITSTAVSASMHDGKLYISGRGSHRDYLREVAVVWVLDNVPAPGTLALPLAAAAPLALRRRRTTRP